MPNELLLENGYKVGRACNAPDDIERHAGDKKGIPLLAMASFAQLLQVEEFACQS